MKKNGHRVKISGPIISNPIILERGLKKLYNRSKDKKYIKYNWTNTYKSSKELTTIDKSWNPDVIFSMTPSPLFFYRGKTPCIFRTDTTFLGMNEQGAEYLNHAPIMLKQMVWQEKIAFSKSAKIITHSKWSKKVIINKYGVDPSKIAMFPNPSSFPFISLKKAEIDTKIVNTNFPINLLFVGRDGRRKGIDIAIEIVNTLNVKGVKARLSIVGLNGENGPNHEYYGIYNKCKPTENSKYLSHYKNSSLLLHPARFEAAGIVPSEAAAFGLPTITNNIGGLGTTVKNGVSGIVLPRTCNVTSYVKAIQLLIDNPIKYKKLCLSTRDRYEKELNWDKARITLELILKNTIK